MPNILTKYARDGKVSFQAIVRVDKRRPVKKTFDTYEEAENWRVAKDAELRSLLATVAHEYTLEEVLIEFTRDYKAVQTVYLAAKLSHIVSAPAKDLAEESLEALRESELNLLECVIEHARKHMGVVVPQNPVCSLKARRKNLAYRPLTEFEEELLITRARTMANAALSDVLILALDTALAQQEILDLTASQIDLGANLIRMSASRAIPLTPRALNVVQARMSKGGPELFSGLPKNTIQTALLRLRKYLGLSGPDFNDLRKIAAARLARQMSLAEVQAALGYARFDSVAWLADGRFILPLNLADWRQIG
jgi:integrase